MKEEDLSHRGLMKLANAKLSYLIDLLNIELYERRNGTQNTSQDYKIKIDEKYNKLTKDIFTKDKMIGEK